MVTHLSDPVGKIQYSTATLNRARRAIGCAPFRLKLLTDMRLESVAINAIADAKGIRNGYTQRPLPELVAENELLWLIQVGLLRREVDGQGLTDSFRLTPLGRQVVAKLEGTGFPDSRPSVRDQLYNSLSRWLRLPGWLQ